MGCGATGAIAVAAPARPIWNPTPPSMMARPAMASTVALAEWLCASTVHVGLALRIPLLSMQASEADIAMMKAARRHNMDTNNRIRNDG